MLTSREEQTQSSNTRTLVTGFGPFGSVTVNPSSQLAAECGRPFQILEVSYAAADQFLGHLSLESFDLLVMLGVASQSQRMRFETVARNTVGTTPDVRGIVLGPGTIDSSDPAQISLPPTASIPMNEHWETSRDAGEYLCNYLFFRACRRFPEKRLHFIHIPPFETLPPQIQLAELGRALHWLERA